jgi:hypothetical protein
MDMVTAGACLPGLIAKVYSLIGKDYGLKTVLSSGYQNFLCRELDEYDAKQIVESSFNTVEALSSAGESYMSIYRRVASPGGGTERAQGYLVRTGYYSRLRNELKAGDYSAAESEARHLEIALNHFKGR